MAVPDARITLKRSACDAPRPGGRACCGPVAPGLRRLSENFPLENGRALGCDGPTIVAHIEAQLTDGLTWENYGERWQIDHNISLLCDPGASGGLPSATEIRDRCHYTNLRPIAIADHRAKTLAERATRRALVVADAARLELTDADIDAILVDVFG